MDGNDGVHTGTRSRRRLSSSSNGKAAKRTRGSCGGKLTPTSAAAADTAPPEEKEPPYELYQKLLDSPDAGTRVWVKMPGYCHWPAIVFSLRHCRNSEVAALVYSYSPGRTLVHFYGTHQHSWSSGNDTTPWASQTAARMEALTAYGRRSGSKAASTTLAEMKGAQSDPARELRRVCRLRDDAARPAARETAEAAGGTARHHRKPMCDACGQNGTQISCRRCHLAFHTLCLPTPAVSPADWKPGDKWTCASCSHVNEVRAPSSRPAAAPAAAAAEGVHGGGGTSSDPPPGAGSSQGSQDPQAAVAAAPRLHGWALYQQLLQQEQQAVEQQQQQLQQQQPEGQGQQHGLEDGQKEGQMREGQVQQAPGRVQGQEEGQEQHQGEVPHGGEGADGGGPMAVDDPAAACVPLVPGTRVWVKMPGYCHWPAIVFSLRHCRKREVGPLVDSHQPGRTLLHFYGEHNHVWVPPASLDTRAEEHDAHLTALQAWTRRTSSSSGALAVEELAGALADPAAELARVLDVRDDAAALEERATRRCNKCGETAAEVTCASCRMTFHALCLPRPALSAAHLTEGRWACGECGADNVHEGCPEEEKDPDQDKEVSERMGLTPDWIIHAAAYQVFGLPKPTRSEPYIKGLLDPCTNSKQRPNIPAEKLYDKKDDGLRLSNSWAGHYILLNPPYSSQGQWRFVNRAIDEVESDSVPAVLLLCRNSTDTEYFQRLRPYPRIMLRRSSTRFKDYDKTPIGFGVALFCIAKQRTASGSGPGPGGAAGGPGQGLHPQLPTPPPPRPTAHGGAASTSVAGTGGGGAGGSGDTRVAVLEPAVLYQRFMDVFADWGEPNIPIDRAFVRTPEFSALLLRLAEHARQHYRTHWVQCSACRKWRIISYEEAQGLRDGKDWSCSKLRSGEGCATPQSRAEATGVHYAPYAPDRRLALQGLDVWEGELGQGQGQQPEEQVRLQGEGQEQQQQGQEQVGDKGGEQGQVGCGERQAELRGGQQQGQAEGQAAAMGAGPVRAEGQAEGQAGPSEESAAAGAATQAGVGAAAALALLMELVQQGSAEGDGTGAGGLWEGVESGAQLVPKAQEGEELVAAGVFGIVQLGEGVGGEYSGGGLGSRETMVGAERIGVGVSSDGAIAWRAAAVSGAGKGSSGSGGGGGDRGSSAGGYGGGGSAAAVAALSEVASAAVAGGGVGVGSWGEQGRKRESAGSAGGGGGGGGSAINTEDSGGVGQAWPGTEGPGGLCSGGPGWCVSGHSAFGVLGSGDLGRAMPAWDAGGRDTDISHMAPVGYGIGSGYGGDVAAGQEPSMRLGTADGWYAGGGQGAVSGMVPSVGVGYLNVGAGGEAGAVAPPDARAGSTAGVASGGGGGAALGGLWGPLPIPVRLNGGFVFMSEAARALAFAGEQ